MSNTSRAYGGDMAETRADRPPSEINTARQQLSENIERLAAALDAHKERISQALNPGLTELGQILAAAPAPSRSELAQWLWETAARVEELVSLTQTLTGQVEL